MLHGLRFQRCALFARFGLEQGYVSRDRYLLSLRTNLQFAIDGGETDLHGDRAANYLLKPPLSKGNRVRARNDGIRVIKPRLVRGEGLRHTRIDIQHDDCDCGNDRSRSVGYRAANVAGAGALSKASPASENQ